MVPMLRGVGRMDEILGFAGDTARRDVMREAPPVYGMARLAGAFRPLPPLARTFAAMAVMMGATAVLTGGLRKALRSS